MKDPGLYSRILGLSDPWFVADVALDTAGGRVDVHVAHAAGVRWHCPGGGWDASGPFPVFMSSSMLWRIKPQTGGDGTGLGEVEAGQTTGESADLETAGG